MSMFIGGTGHHCLRVGTVAAALTLAANLSAVAAGVGSRSALAGTDSISWAQLGPSQASVSSGSSATSTHGVTASILNPGGPMMRFDEGDGVYLGNFAAGDALLSTAFSAGVVLIDFQSGVSRIGAQIQANDYGGFVGTIKAFNVGNVLLETQSFVGLSTDLQDNSAIFVGIARATADIDHVEFSVSGSTSADFAINGVDFAALVPELPSVAMLLLGLGFVGVWGGRSRSKV